LIIGRTSDTVSGRFCLEKDRFQGFYSAKDGLRRAMGELGTPRWGAMLPFIILVSNLRISTNQKGEGSQ
jgi:hypothetical protein